MYLLPLVIAVPLGLASIVLSVGCGGSGDALQRHQPAASLASNPTSHGDTASLKEVPKTGEADTSVAKSATSPSSEEEKEFRPPFPERTELFKQGAAGRSAARVHQRQEDKGEGVALKGFVHVDRPQAMLQVNGELWIAHEGDSRAELPIVRVSPPNVSITRLGQRLELSIRGDQ